MTLTRDGLVELVRREIARGIYQMPYDTLPYETKAQVVVGAIEAAGYLDIREAEKRRRYAALDEIQEMGSDDMPYEKTETEVNAS